jgi:hypothetical protein
MTIIGWKAGVNSQKAIQSINKNTTFTLLEAKKLVEKAINGEPVVLPDDFVLREELEEYRFIVK